ncbi:MAG: carbohydrate-binding family 9-like protein [bacterium]
MNSCYIVRRTSDAPEFTGNWNGPVWSRAETLTLEHFHPAGSDHKPGVSARLLYDNTALYVHFRVTDRYVRSVVTEPQGPVCQDSCVELFYQPKPDRGYLSMEGNCGGTFLSHYIEDHRHTPTGFAKYTPIAREWFSRIRAFHSLPAVVDPEIIDRVEWQLEYCIPFALMESYVGPVGNPSGQIWRMNLFKCGDKTSHPHWGSWSPIGDELNFHQPSRFAPVNFA